MTTRPFLRVVGDATVVAPPTQTFSMDDSMAARRGDALVVARRLFTTVVRAPAPYHDWDEGPGHLLDAAASKAAHLLGALGRSIPGYVFEAVAVDFEGPAAPMALAREIQSWRTQLARRFRRLSGPIPSTHHDLLDRWLDLAGDASGLLLAVARRFEPLQSLASALEEHNERREVGREVALAHLEMMHGRFHQRSRELSGHECLSFVVSFVADLIAAPAVRALPAANRTRLFAALAQARAEQEVARDLGVADPYSVQVIHAQVAGELQQILAHEHRVAATARRTDKSERYAA